jgi:hypothetical protein
MGLWHPTSLETSNCDRFHAADGNRGPILHSAHESRAQEKSVTTHLGIATDQVTLDRFPETISS